MEEIKIVDVAQVLGYVYLYHPQTLDRVAVSLDDVAALRRFEQMGYIPVKKDWD